MIFKLEPIERTGDPETVFSHRDMQVNLIRVRLTAPHPSGSATLRPKARQAFGLVPLS
jgi:hypothetical protein